MRLQPASFLTAIFRALVMLGLLALLGCGDSPKLTHIQGKTMGTSYSIKVVLPAEQDEAQLQKNIDASLAQFDLDLSNWNPKSWVRAFNASTSTDWQSAPPSAINVLKSCIELNEKSRGAFDVTISPLIETWGFGVRTDDLIPSMAEIQKALANMGGQHLHLDVKNAKVKKDIPTLTINTSALAKGYGVDLIAQQLEALDLKNYMIEIGGEIHCSGAPPQREGWNIGIRKPSGGKGLSTSEIHSVVTLKNQSMATSGDYQNFFTHEGKRYSHVLDPNTGRPVAHNLCSVTVIAPNCALADGLATTCLVLGTKLSLSWIKLFPDCSLYLIERQEDDTFVTYRSDNFPE